MSMNTTEKILIGGALIGGMSVVGYVTYKKFSKDKQEAIDNQVVKTVPKLAEGLAFAGEQVSHALRTGNEAAQAVFPSESLDR